MTVTPSSGIGSGTLRVVISPNPGPVRLGKLTVVGFLNQSPSPERISITMEITQGPLIVPIPSSPSFLWFASTYPDFIGRGETRLYSESNTIRFTSVVFSNRSVNINVLDRNQVLWSVRLGAPLGQVLTQGTYENTEVLATATNGELDFSGDGRGCNRSFGRFTVMDVGFTSSGSLARLHASFEHHCEGPTAPPLNGEVWVVVR